MNLEQYLQNMIEAGAERLIISNPVSGKEPCRKIIAERKDGYFQIAKYTQKQVFHENLSVSDAAKACSSLAEGHFKQVNGLSPEKEHILLISKKGACTYKVKQNLSVRETGAGSSHNRKKAIFWRKEQS